MSHVQSAAKIARFLEILAFFTFKSSDFSLISSPETVLRGIISRSVVATGISIPRNKTHRDSAFVGAEKSRPATATTSPGL
jgi:hypothetical protein